MSTNKNVKTAKRPEFKVKDYLGRGLSEDEINELKQAFDMFDADKSGEIDLVELKNSLQGLGIDTTKGRSIESLMSELDGNNSQTVDFNEFFDMMTPRMPEKVSRAEWEKLFNLYLGDDKKGGKISVKHLRRVANDLQETIEDYELQEMISGADLDKDGLVNLDEFIKIMTKKVQA